MFNPLPGLPNPSNPLFQQPWHATVRASFILARHGLDSPEFAEADKIARVPSTRLAEMIQGVTGKPWIASDWTQPYRG